MFCCSEDKNCCGFGAKIFGHLVGLVGAFMLSWGFLSVTGIASWSAVFSSLFFWGLVVMCLGFCILNCKCSDCCDTQKK